MSYGMSNQKIKDEKVDKKMRKRKGKDFIKGYQVVKVSNAIIYIDALLVWIGRSLFLYEM